MDKDKLNKAAEEYQENSNVSMENFYPSDIEDAFMAGAEWLMQQPLSERLTDEEKEKIRDIIKYPQRYTVPIDETLFFQVIGIQRAITEIFGAEIFREK